MEGNTTLRGLYKAAKGGLEVKEIKFRAWLKPSKKLCNVLSIHFGKKSLTISVQDGAGKTWFSLDNENAEVMQYTGLKDKNGVEIYEGDICRYNLDNSLHIVEFINNHWSAFCFIELATQECNHLYEFDDFEVVGNIYESPELLKGDKE